MESILGVSGGEGSGAEKGHTGFLFATSSLEALLRVWAVCSGHLTISFPKLWPGGLIWSPAGPPSHSQPSTHHEGLSCMAEDNFKKRPGAPQSLLPIQHNLPPPLSAFPSQPVFWHPLPPDCATFHPDTCTWASFYPRGLSRALSSPWWECRLPPCQGRLSTSQEAPVGSRQPFRPKYASLILRGCSSFCFPSSFSQGK